MATSRSIINKIWHFQMITEVQRWSGHTALALWIPLNLIRIFSESESQIKWLNKGVPRVIITKPILKSSWRVFVTNGSFGQWLAVIYNHGPSIESNECLSPKSITMPSPQNVAIVKVYSPVYTQLTWTSVSVGTWRFCLIGLQASWQVCICICASVCVRLCLFVPFMEETF